MYGPEQFWGNPLCGLGVLGSRIPAPSFPWEIKVITSDLINLRDEVPSAIKASKFALTSGSWRNKGCHSATCLAVAAAQSFPNQGIRSLASEGRCV
eukprot:4064305-Amphidinium_carterae.1